MVAKDQVSMQEMQQYHSKMQNCIQLGLKQRHVGRSCELAVEVPCSNVTSYKRCPAIVSLHLECSSRMYNHSGRWVKLLYWCQSISCTLDTYPDSSDGLCRAHIMECHCGDCKLGYSDDTVTGTILHAVATEYPQSTLKDTPTCSSHRLILHYMRPM